MGDGSLFEALCEQQTYLRWVFSLASVFCLFSVPYLFVTEWGSAIFVVSTMNAVGFFAFAAVSGVLLRRCRRREN